VECALKGYLGYVQWLTLGILFTFLALLSLHYVIYPLLKTTFPTLGEALESIGWIEIFYLWSMALIVVGIASGIHHCLASLEISHLEKQAKNQQEKQEPEAFHDTEIASN
jgi:hypothetical protein